jgi:hypothetical protein
MPYEIVWRVRRVFSRFFGTATAADLARNFEEVSADSRFDELFCHIIDFRDVVEFAVTDQELRFSTAPLIGAARSNNRLLVATVANRDHQVAFLRRLGSVGVAPYLHEIFPTIEAATDWANEQSAQIRALKIPPRIRDPFD